MTTSMSLEEIEKAIQVVEANLRELQEQAAGFSGAADEDRIADRINAQQAKLDELREQRAVLLASKNV